MASVNRFSYQSGTTTATVTVAAGAVVSCIRAHNTSGGATLVITPAGGSALPTITIPAGANWFELNFDVARQELVDGATLAFTGTDAFFVGQRVESGI